MPGNWSPSPKLRSAMILYVLLMALLLVTAVALGEAALGICGAIAALPGVVLCIVYTRRSG
jgi:hypothetical protein